MQLSMWLSNDSVGEKYPPKMGISRMVLTSNYPKKDGEDIT